MKKRTIFLSCLTFFIGTIGFLFAFCQTNKQDLRNKPAKEKCFKVFNNESFDEYILPLVNDSCCQIVIPPHWNRKDIVLHYNNQVCTCFQEDSAKFFLTLFDQKPYKVDIMQLENRTLFITTETDSPTSLRHKGQVEQGDFLIYNTDEQTFCEGKIDKLEIRGNTTAGRPKKPYNIKLKKKAALLGLKSAKKFCLLANALDESSLRNWIGLQAAQAIDMDYHLGCNFVNLYINHSYKGLYLITEKRDASKIGLGLSEKDFFIETNVREFEYEEDAGFLSYNGQLCNIKYPDKPSKQQIEEVKAQYDTLLQMLTSQQNTIKNLSSHFDLRSIADYYLISELLMNFDGVIRSVFLYQRNEKMYCGPVWDFDQAINSKVGDMHTGIHTSRLFSEDGYFIYHLMRYPVFRQIVKQEYHKKLRPFLQELLDNRLDSIITEIRNDRSINNRLWQYDFLNCYYVLGNTHRERTSALLDSISKIDDDENIRSTLQIRKQFFEEQILNNLQNYQ